MHNHNTPRRNNPNTTSKWDILTEEQAKAGEYSAGHSFNPELFDSTQCQKVMDAISAPTDDPDGAAKIMDRLKAKHELRILAEMSGAGFDNWEHLNSDDVETFIANYPSPADFDDVSSNFLNEIGTFNGSQKLAQYEQAMNSFKHKVYGAKQIYYEQIKAIDALQGQSSSEQSIERPRASQPERHQIEHSAEWEPGLPGVSQVSRSQVRQGVNLNELLNSLAPDQTCQDSCLIRQDEGLFGVFDGAGGHDGGREASMAAANSINQACNKYNLKSGSDLAYILNAANRPVQDATRGSGYTTATLAKIIEHDGQKMLAYASVGDSRLYLVRADGATELITRDEGEGNKITNALGISGDDRTRQYGEVAVSLGDRVVLCSDGVTGDFGDDLMADEELGNIVRRSKTPKDAAANLVASARKTDDRTTVVFSI